MGQHSPGQARHSYATRPRGRMPHSVVATIVLLTIIPISAALAVGYVLTKMVLPDDMTRNIADARRTIDYCALDPDFCARPPTPSNSSPGAPAETAPPTLTPSPTPEPSPTIVAIRPPAATPSPTPAAPVTVKPRPRPTPPVPIEIRYRVINNFRYGFDAELTMTNTTGGTWNGWNLTFQLPGASVVGARGAEDSQVGDSTVLRASDVVAPGSQVRFYVRVLGDPTRPTGCSLDEQPCTFTSDQADGTQDTGISRFIGGSRSGISRFF